MPLNSARALVAHEFEQFKTLIRDNINSNIGLVDDLSHHIFKSGGKRIRPLILLLTGKACGILDNDHILSAAAIEYFHTATLLHDDVLDESQLRRGQHTANSLWGDKTSILVGDILLTQSIQFMTQTNRMPMLSVLINAAHDITCGEVKQLANAHASQLNVNDYFDVIRAKTAKLFSATTEIGAMASNMPQPIIENMRAYGLHLGNAFQIIDDLLDYKATSDILGKEPGDDLREGKITLPLIYTLESASRSEKELIQNSLKDDSKDNFSEILQMMHKYHSFEKTLITAKQEGNKALVALDLLANSQAKKSLANLVDFTLNRSH